MSMISSSIPVTGNGNLPVPNIGVPQTRNASLIRAAATLSEETNILSSSTNGSSAAQSTDPVSLLSWLIQPFNSTPPPVPAPGTGATAFAGIQESIDQQLLGGLATDPVINSTYNASGALQTPSNGSAINWAAVVKGNPNGAAAMTNDASYASIISHISTYA